MASNIKDRILELSDASNHREIIKAFKTIDSLVGLSSAKNQIYEYAMVNLYRKKMGRANCLMNLILSGPPGVGKTTLAKAIGELYVATGMISGTSTPEPLSEFEKFLLNKHLLNLQNQLHNLRRKYAERLKQTPSEYHQTVKQFFESLDSVECSKRILNKKVEVSSGKFVVTDRQGLIGEYIGATAIKTTNVLKRALGGVLFIDEAYSLCGESERDFGFECLTTINNFITEHPGEIVVILAGYKDLIEKNLFSQQPGLESRFLPQIEMKTYSIEDLVTMFRCKMNQYKLPSVKDLIELFSTHENCLTHFGRDVDTLILMSEIAYVTDCTDLTDQKNIQIRHIESGFKRMKSRQIEEKLPHMYL